MNYTEINDKKREISAELRELHEETMRLISRYGLTDEEKADNERKIQENDTRSKQLWKLLDEVGNK